MVDSDGAHKRYCKFLADGWHEYHSVAMQLPLIIYGRFDISSELTIKSPPWYECADVMWSADGMSVEAMNVPELDTSRLEYTLSSAPCA
nr:hypothetical protein CFP56_00190 [Quercus suber]